MTLVTEKAFQQTVRAMAVALGWTVFCTYDSRRSPEGEPDLRMVHPKQRRVIWAELKSNVGKTTPLQEQALETLREAGAEVFLWRPAMMDAIEKILRGW